MKLYHGTNEESARSIIAGGAIQPRGLSKHKGNWTVVPSHKRRVYLTTAYAPFFAACAAKEGGRLVVVEVETDLMERELFRPDEDFLEQATLGRLMSWENPLPGQSMEQRTKWFRDHADQYAHCWEDSVAGLGTCSYEGAIPLDAVTKIVAFDPKEAVELAWAFMDPSITLLNYKFCGSKYRAMTRWFAGEAVSPIEMFTSFGEQEWDLLPEKMRVRFARAADNQGALLETLHARSLGQGNSASERMNAQEPYDNAKDSQDRPGRS